MNTRRLNSTEQDFEALWAMNPFAHEQLKNIILERMLREAEARLSQVNGNQELDEEIVAELT